MYYRWSKAFLDAGKNGLTRDTQRDMTSDEVRALKRERHEDDIQNGRAERDENDHIDMAGPHLKGEEVREPRHTVVQEQEDAQEEENTARELGVSPGNLDVCDLCHGCRDKGKG